MGVIIYVTACILVGSLAIKVAAKTIGSVVKMFDKKDE